MAHSKSTQNEARQLYIDGGLSLEKISERLKVSVTTLSAWKAKSKAVGDDWEKLRAVNASGRTESIARNILISLMTAFGNALEIIDKDVEMDPLEKVNALANLSEGFARSVNANKKLMPEVSKLEVALDVVSELTQFVGDKTPDLLKDFADVLEPFSEQLEKKLKD